VCLTAALLLAAWLLLRPFAPGSRRRIMARIERYGPQHATAHPARPGQGGARGRPANSAAGGMVNFGLDGSMAGHPHTPVPGPPGPGNSGPPPGGPAPGGGTARLAAGLAATLLRATNTEAGLAQRLDHAGIARGPAQWLLLTCCGGAGLAAMLTAATGNPLGVPAGALAAWLVMRLVLSVRTGRRRAAFGEQLPDVLRLNAGSLQSGISLPQAVDAVVRDDTQPAAGEFSRALAEVRVGADLGDALNRVADRMACADLRLTVMAVRIQREVGGNLAEVLTNSVGTMRERAFLRRQVKALSAEGRMSAYILLALPFAVGAWFFVVDPRYMSLLYTTVPGLLMLGGSGVLIALGVLWMRKLINIEV
jgi:tight adherence protein B